ncbi:hypothetical protein NOVO_08650 [Rickettsiales bacterium Ac37b]|nr:hypothetical protein NOVO_08650 [Rickettsiales bacterium Ac37b]
MATIQTILNQVIHCNGKHYTITTDDYPVHLQRNLNHHIQEVRSDQFTEPVPGVYMGFKIETNHGVLVVNSTKVPCHEDFYLINIYPRFKLESIVDDLTPFFPEHVKCMNLCFAGVTNESNDI